MWNFRPSIYGQPFSALSDPWNWRFWVETEKSKNDLEKWVSYRSVRSKDMSICRSSNNYWWSFKYNFFTWLRMKWCFCFLKFSPEYPFWITKLYLCRKTILSSFQLIFLGYSFENNEQLYRLALFGSSPLVFTPLLIFLRFVSFWLFGPFQTLISFVIVFQMIFSIWS